MSYSIFINGRQTARCMAACPDVRTTEAARRAVGPREWHPGRARFMASPSDSRLTFANLSSYRLMKFKTGSGRRPPNVREVVRSGRCCTPVAARGEWCRRRLHLWADRPRIRPDLQGDRDDELRPGRHHDAGRILRLQPDRALGPELLDRRRAGDRDDRRLRLRAGRHRAAAGDRPAAIRRRDADPGPRLHLPRRGGHHLGLRFGRLRNAVHQQDRE